MTAVLLTAIIVLMFPVYLLGALLVHIGGVLEILGRGTVNKCRQVVAALEIIPCFYLVVIPFALLGVVIELIGFWTIGIGGWLVGLCDKSVSRFD